MLLTVADFVGEYRLHNTNNVNPDLLLSIDEAQSQLARSLFRQGAEEIIANTPLVAPNLGLRLLGLHEVFLPWCFLRVQLAVLGAGVAKASEVPAQNLFASGNFVKVAGKWRTFLERFKRYERAITCTAVANNTLQLNEADAVWQGLLFPNASALVSGVGGVQVVSVSVGVSTTDFVLNITTLTVGANYTFKQTALVLDDRSFIYF